MKLIIDIHEKDYQSILNSGQVPYGVVYAIMNGTPLPKEATNGDMIKAMFPDVEIEENPSHKKCGSFYLTFKGNTCTMVTDYSWWNALYKRGGEDEDCD